jgi:hypothetical protein
MAAQVARIAVIAAAVLVVFSGCRRSEPTGAVSESPPRIELNQTIPGSATIDVIGLPQGDVSRLEQSTLTRDQWTALLRVTVAGQGGRSSDQPAVLGTYGIVDRTLRFTPQFPFDPGQRYDVVFDPLRLPSSAPSPPATWRARPVEAAVELPAPTRPQAARVVGVFPSGGEVPENQLRMYIVFSAPMGLRGGSEHVRLVDHTGRSVDDPFLPLDVDLWNEDRTRYTLLFDPGRVKRGILPNEEMGRALMVGQKYTLEVDEAWRDGSGQKLAAPFRREFRVAPAEEHAIDPATWRIDPPSDGTRGPLVVTFPRPLDYGLLQSAVAVSTARGDRVPGDIRIEAAETRWLFVPRAPWEAQEYRLVASSALEDVAGNRIGRPFEVEAPVSGAPKAEARPAVLVFRVAPRPR